MTTDCPFDRALARWGWTKSSSATRAVAAAPSSGLNLDHGRGWGNLVPDRPAPALDSVVGYGAYSLEKAGANVEFLTIGRFARQAGVGVETIRFYEREGLIAEPARRPSGYRQYTPEAVRRIRFVRHAKALGFTLKEIRELLELRVRPDSSCADVRARVRLKIEDVEARLVSLVGMKAALTRLGARCHSDRPTGGCPILEELDREGLDSPGTRLGAT